MQVCFAQLRDFGLQIVDIDDDSGPFFPAPLYAIRHRLGRSSRPKRPTRVSAHLDQGNAPDWIETALADGVPGVARVVNHSIVSQYLSNVDRARFDCVMAVAGEAATDDKPLAWLNFEPADNLAEYFGPTEMTGCWPDPESMGNRYAVDRTRELEIANCGIGF
jgi:hypothetical protein